MNVDGLWPKMRRETFLRNVSSRRMTRRTRRSGHGGISAWSTPIPPRRLQRVRGSTHRRLKNCSSRVEHGTVRDTPTTHDRNAPGKLPASAVMVKRDVRGALSFCGSLVATREIHIPRKCRCPISMPEHDTPQHTTSLQLTSNGSVQKVQGLDITSESIHAVYRRHWC